MQLKAIAMRPKSQANMIVAEHAEISANDGLYGDYRSRPGSRQITLLSTEQWQIACLEIGIDLPWTARRANLLVDGIQFDQSYLGKVIRFNQVELLICAETEPCRKMDQYHQGLRQALTPDWRGGVCCKVLTGGVINVGEQLAIYQAK